VVPSTPRPMANVTPAIDIAAAHDFAFLKGATIGVLANQASVDTNGIHLVSLLDRSQHCTLAKLFAPEHGFLGAAQHMISVPDENDNTTGIEIISLYGDDTLRKAAEGRLSIETILKQMNTFESWYEPALTQYLRY